ncbi:MAG: sugar ABC transporter substrate-binding protein [Propionibacteriaceae bacterium]|nr:sugar ABC transporter substrate-binding protein [Propionibacteriaceae bacterium]
MKLAPKLTALLAAAALGLTACGSTADTAQNNGGGQDGNAPSSGETVKYTPGDVVKPKDGKTVKIGASFPVLDQFLKTVADSIEERGKAAGVEVNITSAEEKVEVQLNQIENFIANGVDALIVLPQDTATTQQITEKAKAANIPLIYVNRRPDNLPAGVPYVGSDSLYAGQIEMEELAKLAGEKGNVFILQGDATQEAAQMRTKGCEETAKKYPNMKVVATQSGLWQRDKGLAITETWLQGSDEVNVICSNNDEMALGAIQALKNAGKLDDVIVGGVDATKDAIAAMEAGELEVTVFQDAKGQGQAGVDTAIKMINGETVPAVVDVPYVLVTPENMAEYK